MDLYEEIVKLRKAGRKGALATIINTRGSTPSFQSAKMLVQDDGSVLGTVGGGCVENEVRRASREVMDQERPRTLVFNLNDNPNYDNGLSCGGTLEIFIEPISPPTMLYVFGAGHIALSLYRIAVVLGYDVVIVDDRESLASRARFPEAREIIVDSFEAAFQKVTPSEASFVVIATRGHRDDMCVLRWAVSTKAQYVGMIGSKRKVITISKELENEGIASDKLARVFAPIGLDIGALTPEEIAISIFAEIIAIRRRASAALPHLRYVAK